MSSKRHKAVHETRDLADVIPTKLELLRELLDQLGEYELEDGTVLVRCPVTQAICRQKAVITEEGKIQYVCIGALDKTYCTIPRSKQ